MWGKYRTRKHSRTNGDDDDDDDHADVMVMLVMMMMMMMQPRPQGLSLKKWVGREKVLASPGHVHPKILGIVN